LPRPFLSAAFLAEGRGFNISKKSGLFPKGWLFAKPKKIQYVAKADTTFFYLSTT
jgi:hypothetical protein